MGDKCIQKYKMTNKTCPQCKSKLEQAEFNIGYGINIESLHCRACGFNITDNKKLKIAINSLKSQMSKEIKIVAIGNGLGIRFPNELIKNYKLKKGEEIMIKPETDGIKLITQEVTKTELTS